MRETKFIEQNKEKWKDFENTLNSQGKDPEKLNELFVQITDDLSHSRTFYPNRSVRVYLNGLAQRIFFLIYRNKQSQKSRIVTFWTEELPLLVYESRPAFRLSFFVFTICFLIGVLSSMMDPDFAEIVLGERYVEMTLENIKSGDPMRVYKQNGEFGMFVGITINNIFVAFLTFVFGVFYMIGSIAVLARNAIMVGVFQYFFIEKGLFWESFLTIWIHGTLEISAIVIAGAAGITMGRGLAFPGTYTRLQSFQKSARRGIKIIFGTVPIFILAGFFEGYLTRHTEAPPFIRGIFIFICLAFVLFYFVWYPFYMAKKKNFASADKFTIPPTLTNILHFYSIKPVSQIFSEMFVLFGKHSRQIFRQSLLIAILFTSIVFLTNGSKPSDLFSFPAALFQPSLVLTQFFSWDNKVVLITSILCLSLVLYFIYRRIGRSINNQEQQKGWKKRTFDFIKSIVIIAELYVVSWVGGGFLIMAMLLLYPLILLQGYVMINENLGWVSSLRRTLRLAKQGYSRMFGFFLILFLLGFLFFSITDSAVLWFFISLLEWVISFEQHIMDEISVVLLTVVVLFTVYLISAMFLLGTALLYYVLVEIEDAPSLISNIQLIGTKQKLKGIERE